MSGVPHGRIVDSSDETPGEPRVVSSDSEVQTVLGLLSDQRVRSILAETSETARSAREIGERCDLPPSTAYRKLDEMVEAGLLAERTRVRRVGKHPSEFRRVVDQVTVSVGAGGETYLVVFEG